MLDPVGPWEAFARVPFFRTCANTSGINAMTGSIDACKRSTQVSVRIISCEAVHASRAEVTHALCEKSCRAAESETGRNAALAYTSGAKLADWQVRKLTVYIEENLSNTIRAKDLSALVKLSTSHLTRALVASIGTPPYQFVIRKRIERAQSLLQSTRRSLAGIALDCGLNDQSSLCRLFRHTVGQTPQQWRRAHALKAKHGQASSETISRRPNHLPSAEYAPGPRRHNAVAFRMTIEE